MRAYSRGVQEPCAIITPRRIIVSQDAIINSVMIAGSERPIRREDRFMRGKPSVASGFRK